METPSCPRTGWLEPSLFLILLPGLVLATILWQRVQHDYTPELLDQAGVIQAVRLNETRFSTAGQERSYEISSTRGYRFTLRLRLPGDAGPASPRPVLLILGGLQTGSQVISLVDRPGNLILAGLDYVYTGKKRYRNLEFLADLPRISRALAESFGAVLLALDFLATLPEVNPYRIIVVGASFGAPYGIMAAALDRRVAALIVAHGGGQLTKSVLRQLPEKYRGLTPLLWPLATYLLAPYEPRDYIPRVAPRPVLMIFAGNDERLPRSAMTALESRAREPKCVKWIETGHVLPSRHAVLDTLLSVSEEWLQENDLLD